MECSVKNRQRSKFKAILLAFLLIIVPFYFSYGLNITAEFTGPGIIYDMEEKIQVQSPFSVEIYFEYIPSDSARIGFSSPFRFYGTGDVTTLINPGHVSAGLDFSIFLPPYSGITYQSWDGDLTNGDPAGDQFHYASIYSWPPGSGNLLAFIVNFDGIVGNNNATGQFCIDSGDFINNTFDWLFQPPVPFGPICLDIIYLCGDVNDDGDRNIFDVTYLISFLYVGGPAPDPPEIADVNNDGTVNMFDITYFISYLYLDGPELNCP